MPNQLGGDEVGGGRMNREIPEYRFTLALPGLVIGLTQKDLGAGLVQVLAKIKAAREPTREPTLAAAD